MDFKEKLKIDKYSLDEECIHQPELYSDVALEAVKAAEERDMKKFEMERKYAELDRTYRLAGEKQSNPQIDAAVTRDPSYQEAQIEYLRTKAIAAEKDVYRTAFEQRKTMLELVCRLFLADYFSDVSVKVGNKVSREKMTDAIEKEVAKAIARKHE